MGRRYPSPEASFDARIQKDDTGCWLWTGFVDRKGYGIMGVGGRKISKVHRYSYERFVGTIPAGLQIDHLCRVRHCANPSHLEPVTPQENVIRGVEARPMRKRCIRGHVFNELNTYINPKGNRECRTCRTAAVARYKEKAVGTRNQ